MDCVLDRDFHPIVWVYTQESVPPGIFLFADITVTRNDQKSCWLGR